MLCKSLAIFLDYLVLFFRLCFALLSGLCAVLLIIYIMYICVHIPFIYSVYTWYIHCIYTVHIQYINRYKYFL